MFLKLFMKKLLFLIITLSPTLALTAIDCSVPREVTTFRHKIPT